MNAPACGLLALFVNLAFSTACVNAFCTMDSSTSRPSLLSCLGIRPSVSLAETPTASATHQMRWDTFCGGASGNATRPQPSAKSFSCTPFTLRRCSSSGRFNDCGRLTTRSFAPTAVAYENSAYEQSQCPAHAGAAPSISRSAPLHRGAKRSTTCRREVGPRRFSPLRASVQQATASASEHGSPHQVRRACSQARVDKETTTPRAPDCGIEALTRSLTAKSVRNALTSRSPISPGWRLSLKITIIGRHAEVLFPSVSHLLAPDNLCNQRIDEPMVVGHQSHHAINVSRVDPVHEAEAPPQLRWRWATTTSNVPPILFRPTLRFISGASAPSTASGC